MSSGTDTSQEIKELLDQRNQLEAWLEKLDNANDKPAQVKEKVRADYQARLDKVLAELGSHTSALEASLTDSRSRLAEYQAAEQAIQEELAEAELRHSVGEYDESSWAAMKSEIESRLQEKTTAVAGVSEEIGALEQTLAAATAPPRASQVTIAPPEIQEPPAPAAEAPARSVPAPEPTPAPKAEPEVEIPEPRPEPAAPAPAEPSSASKEASTTAPRQAVTASPEASRVPSTPPTAPSQTDAFRASQAAGGSEARTTKSGSTPAERRTLKCTECSKMNLPTEWYCEFLWGGTSGFSRNENRSNLVAADRLEQSGLCTRRGIPVDQILASSPVEELLSASEGRSRLIL